ncbi:retrovirus-related pol polyprotein from transposon TNT 1-94 [Tanacetum coccineum]|uniref:Retrovirus-related pol polyprotein from transposon TNT 1-94 n=1 Tax=Tanacetum coccineum TaxID=301880 RepID=A0ABQ5FVT9_9ASTR
MIEPFLIINNLMGYVDGSILCPSKTLSITDGATVLKENPNYLIWFSNDAHVHMVIISIISEASFRHVQEYADALAALGEPVKDNDLIMLAIPVGSPSIPEARQAQLSELTAQLSTLGFQVSPIAPSGPQAFYGVRPLNNNKSNNNNNYGNRNNSRGNNNNRGHDTRANSHVTPDLEAMDNSEAYYGDDALHVGNAMKEEYDALMKNGTWSLVPRASNTNVVDGKWVYRLKRDKNGAITHYKARFVAKGNNKGTIDNIIFQLGSAFALKDLGPLNYFLGIEIVLHVSDILLSQKKYILELLQSAGLSNFNPVSSPMVISSSLSLDDSTAFSNPVKYQQVVGSLQYVTLSRPGIAFAVNKVCQYMHALIENRWSVIKRILCYLHGMVEHGMLIHNYSGSTLQTFTDVLWKGNPDTSLDAFSDADWAGD